MATIAPTLAPRLSAMLRADAASDVSMKAVGDRCKDADHTKSTRSVKRKRGRITRDVAAPSHYRLRLMARQVWYTSNRELRSILELFEGDHYRDERVVYSNLPTVPPC